MNLRACLAIFRQPSIPTRTRIAARSTPADLYRRTPAPRTPPLPVLLAMSRQPNVLTRTLIATASIPAYLYWHLADELRLPS